jgi:hypothetical protein
MAKIYKTEQQFDSNPFLCQPIDDEIPNPDLVSLFDQNGYSVTELESLYYQKDNAVVNQYRPNHAYDASYKKKWFFQDTVHSGPCLNHAWLFQRKGFAGEALEQLQSWARKYPIFYKLIKLRPKWGIDFSMDYFDHEGVVFEVFHFEWDCFSFEEIERVRSIVEQKVLAIDWCDAAKNIHARKDEWHHLDFFAQSRWKTDYFNLFPEQFKMVAWD